MVELTLVGWKDPVVLDLPTTDGELEPAAAIPRIILHVVMCVCFLQSPVQVWVLLKVRAEWEVEGVVVRRVSDCRPRREG